MFVYTLKRLVQGVVTVWFIATATFFAMHSVPGDPLMNDKAVSPEVRKNLEAQYGLDKRIEIQYVIYIGNMLQGDFGISFAQASLPSPSPGSAAFCSARSRRATGTRCRIS